MCRRKKVCIGIAVGVMLLLIVGALLMVFNRPKPPGPKPEPTDPILVIALSQAPQDVQDAAKALYTSRVAYAMVKSDKTYIVINTGSDTEKVKYDLNRRVPATGTPTDVEIFMSSLATGTRQVILLAPWGSGVRYEFKLDNSHFPQLFNTHNLPLVYLNAAEAISVVKPVADQQVTTSPLVVAGFANAFESQFDATVFTEKGRSLGTLRIMAPGMGDWGSFMAEVKFDTTSLPERGYVLFEDGGKPMHFMVPIRFLVKQELG
ncbi:MAG: Gmad2 immunoglobulin-like domain-containing protein [Mycobacterium leprae]